MSIRACQLLESVFAWIYNRPILQERLAFRGGTALHKLVLAPATRYSEDIDFVYLRKEPIEPVLSGPVVTITAVRYRSHPPAGGMPK